MVTAGILPFRENSHGRTGNRTRDLMISSQRLRPLDHEAGQLEPAITAIEWLKTHALNRAATGISCNDHYVLDVHGRHDIRISPANFVWKICLDRNV